MMAGQGRMARRGSTGFALGRTLRGACAGLGLVLLPLPSQACEDAACKAQTAWMEAFNGVQIIQRGADGKAGTIITGRYSTKPDTDMAFSYDLPIAEPPKKAEVAVLNGMILLDKGIEGSGASPADSMISPLVMARIAAGLLSQAFPKGPDSVGAQEVVAIPRGTVAIEAAFLSAGARFGAPWSLNGTASRAGNGSISYALVLKSEGEGSKEQTFGEARRPFTYAAEGRFDVFPTDFVMDGAISLEGWMVRAEGIDPKPATVAGLRTIAEARVARKNDIGKPDATRDFSGFWKEKCSNTYGLKISKQPKAHLYALAFCGPGGCDTPVEARKSYIAGDPHMEIVNATTLTIDGSTYLRCER